MSLGSPEWHVPIFGGSAPLLRTAYIRGIAMSNCYFPSAAITELELDIRNLSFDLMNPKFFTFIPNVRVLVLRGSILWMPSDVDVDHPLTLPLLKRLTCGSLCIGSLVGSVALPALRYICLESHIQDPDYDDDDDDEMQMFPNAIAKCPPPTFPNLDELRYDTRTNYAAYSIFTGLPKVSIVQFPQLFIRDDLELYHAFFKALIDDSSQWPYLTTIIFKGLPDQLFSSLRYFVLARSSEEHRLTIRVENNLAISYHVGSVNAEHMEWLQQHVRLQVVHV
jgi:hypothetical protein